jgi:hypothetical protein
MSVLTDIWRQLVRRRLWPVAILLVAAIAAVPMLLAKEPEVTETAAPPASAATADSELADAPIVTASTATNRSPGRKVLGTRHNIFKSTAKKPKVPKQDTAETKPEEQPTQSPSGSGDDKKDSGSGSSGSGGSPAARAQPTTPAPKPKSYPLYSLKVRFSNGGQVVKGYLPVRAALPSTANPLLIYLGLANDHKTAVFMVDAKVQAVGDGECDPTPESCETVRMREGDTMFFDVVDEAGVPSGEQFQVDLLDINKKQTTDAAKAARSSRLAKVSSLVKAGNGLAGGNALRRLGVVGRTG